MQENVNSVATEGFSARLRELIKAKSRTITAFCAETGMPYRSLQQYLSGDSSPSGDVLVRLAAHLQISVHWLLTGTGPKQIEAGSLVITPTGEVIAVVQADANMACDAFLSSFETVSKAVQPDSALARAERAESRCAELERELAELRRPSAKATDYKSALERDLVRLWGVGDVALVAKRGRQAITRAVLSVLLEAHPNNVSSQELVEHLNTYEPILIMSELAALASEGIILSTDDNHRVAHDSIQLPSEETVEHHQQALEAVTELLTHVLPARKKGKGRLVLGDVFVQDGLAYAGQIISSMKDCYQAAEQSVGTQHVRLVLGIAVDEETT